MVAVDGGLGNGLTSPDRRSAAGGIRSPGGPSWTITAPLAPGWARANCSGPVQASLLYRQHNSEGMPTAEAGVNATAVPATRFVTFADTGRPPVSKVDPSEWPMHHPSDTAALVTFTNPGTRMGRRLAIADLMLPPNGHDAQNMPTLFDLSKLYRIAR